MANGQSLLSAGLLGGDQSKLAQALLQPPLGLGEKMDSNGTPCQSDSNLESKCHVCVYQPKLGQAVLQSPLLDSNIAVFSVRPSSNYGMRKVEKDAHCSNFLSFLLLVAY